MDYRLDLAQAFHIMQQAAFKHIGAHQTTQFSFQTIVYDNLWALGKTALEARHCGCYEKSDSPTSPVRRFSMAVSCDNDLMCCMERVRSAVQLQT